MVDSVADRIPSCTKTLRFEVDHVSLQDFQDLINTFSNDEWEQVSSSAISSYLTTFNIFNEEDKINCLKKLLKGLEEKYESLLAQKRSHISSRQRNYFEDSYDEQHEEIFYDDKNIDSFVIDSHDSSSFGHDVVRVSRILLEINQF